MSDQISIPNWQRRFADLLDEAEREGTFYDKEIIAERLLWWSTEFRKQAIIQRIDYEEDLHRRQR